MQQKIPEERRDAGKKEGDLREWSVVKSGQDHTQKGSRIEEVSQHRFENQDMLDDTHVQVQDPATLKSLEK
jgi:hypothetical protein